MDLNKAAAAGSAGDSPHAKCQARYALCCAVLCCGVLRLRLPYRLDQPPPLPVSAKQRRRDMYFSFR